MAAAKADPKSKEEVGPAGCTASEPRSSLENRDEVADPFDRPAKPVHHTAHLF